MWGRNSAIKDLGQDRPSGHAGGNRPDAKTVFWPARNAGTRSIRISPQRSYQAWESGLRDSRGIATNRRQRNGVRPDSRPEAGSGGSHEGCRHQAGTMRWGSAAQPPRTAAPGALPDFSR